MFSIYLLLLFIYIFYGRIYHGVREKYNCSQTKKPRKKTPVYEDKSDSRRKVVIVRNMKLYNQDNFWQMLVYIILLWADHGPLQKTFTKILGLNGKNRPIIVILCITSVHFHFKI